MSSNELIGWFADISLRDRPTVGGKGGSLGELTQVGIAVPAGFVVRTHAFERFVATAEGRSPVRTRVAQLQADDLQSLEEQTAQVRQQLLAEPLPTELHAALASAHAQLCAGDAAAPVAVRSSATTEDAEDASFAGLQDTILWVKGMSGLEQALRQCWASLYCVPSVAYRRRKALPEDGVAMAVVVQKMVDARTAGVMFTRSPATGDRSVVVIEGAWGLGSAVVSGEVTPDRFVVAKLTSEITARDIRDKHVMHVPLPEGGVAERETPDAKRHEPCLTDEQIQQLKDMGRRIEKHYGRAQDIEWAFDQSGALQILQSRPETVWTTKDAAPVATALGNPLQHVMNVFGGRR
jgi:pyruvate, water dikinase